MTPSIHNVFSVNISSILTAAPGGTECMHACPHLVHLGVSVDSNALLYVFLFSLPTDLKQCSPCELAECLPRHKGLWKTRALGGRDVGGMPTLNKETLWAKDSMRDRYHPKMLLYALHELFYIYAQVKNSQRPDEKLVLAYEILCISANCCTD